jgi:uncharacterized protein YjbJ (UPF0337 family)
MNEQLDFQIKIRRLQMNWDQIEGKWKQSVGKVKEKWGKLTDDDLTAINGQRDQLIGKIQERYGIAKDAAQKQVDEFTRAYKTDAVVQNTAKKARA